MIYERIVKYCEEEKLTVAEFEKICKIGNGTVGKWKNNSIKPSIKSLTKIQQYTGVAIGYWIGGII